jgi:N-acetylated-alpha-linked acidic dipeptidase
LTPFDEENAMTFARILAALFLLILLPPRSEPGQDPSLLGFHDAQAQDQRRLETRFDSFLRASNLETWLKRLSARPQHFGSPYRKENAEFILAQFKAWGYDARIETFEIYCPSPKVRRLEMTEPVPYTAVLTEPPVKGDPVTEMKDEWLPSFNVYSPDGEVTAELVYVNQGIPKDYEELERRGISVQGKIVIARYGGCYRGVKPKVAALHGAIGCIIYSDPLDNGYWPGDVYPDGPYRNGYAAERGSVLDITVAPGDPLTPDAGATREAKRLEIKDAKGLAPIPTLPIGYSDALPLLRELKGPVAPASWRGALPITYHLGPGPAKVHLKLECDWKLVPAYDVVAFLKGRERADEWIIRGNHADGWVAGASDPLSSLVSMMEEARAVGELAKAGWRPKRTLVYCAWDAEEPGIIGSTEWV